MERLPAPQESSKQNSQHEAGTRQGRSRNKPGVLSADECLVALGRLPQLVALAILDAAQANAMRAVYQAILSHHQHQNADPTRRAADLPGLRRALEKDPQLANLLVGVLSNEVIDDLLADLDPQP